MAKKTSKKSTKRFIQAMTVLGALGALGGLAAYAHKTGRIKVGKNRARNISSPYDTYGMLSRIQGNRRISTGTPIELWRKTYQTNLGLIPK